MAKHNTFKYCKGWNFNIDSNDSLDAPQCEIRRSVVYSAVLHESIYTTDKSFPNGAVTSATSGMHVL